MSKGYIGMAGLRGYMPNYSEFYETKRAAIRDLCDMHEIPPCGKIARELARDEIVDIDLQVYGNEYLEVIPCEGNEEEVNNWLVT